MKKKASLLLSFMLLSSTISPMAFAEDEVTEETTAVEAEATEAEETEAEEAAARPSDQFADLADLSDEDKDILDALIEAGVFNGVSETEFGINQQMNRAQFAKVAALIFGLEVDDTLTESSFTDVSADDPANGYALPYIEALKDAGLTNGVNPEGTLYNPAGSVSREELATFLIRGLGIEDEVESVDPVEDETVSEWAAGYVALALEKGIMENQEDGTFGGTVAATRYSLAVSAYNASEGVVGEVPAQLSIVSVKQVGAKKVEVKFNKEVDSVAEIQLQSKGNKVDTLGEWNDKYDTVVLELTKEGEKLKQEYYKAVVLGMEEEAVEVGSMEFLAEAEKVKTIDILSNSETLPSSKVTLEVTGINQFGEKTAVKGGDLNITVGAQNKTFNLDSNRQRFTIDLTSERKDTKIPITIMDTRNYVTVSKTFTVGDPLMVTKIDVGDMVFEDNQTRLIAGTKGYLKLDVYDQYGNRIYEESVLRGATGVKAYVVSTSGEIVLIDQEPANDGKVQSFKGNLQFVDIDNDGILELMFEANKNLKADREVTLNIFGGATSQATTKTINVYSRKAPVRVEFRDWPDLRPFTFDAEKPNYKFIEVRMWDSTGYELSKAEIVQAETDEKFRIYSTGPIVLESDKPTRPNSQGDDVDNLKIYEKLSGDRGKIAVKSISTYGPASIFVQFADVTKAPVELKLNITESAKIAGIRVKDNKSSFKMMPGQGVGPVIEIYDNYGSNVTSADSKYQVDFKLEQISATEIKGYTSKMPNNGDNVKDPGEDVVYVPNGFSVKANDTKFEYQEAGTGRDVDNNGKLENKNPKNFTVNLYPLMVSNTGTKTFITPVPNKDGSVDMGSWNSPINDQPFGGWIRQPVSVVSTKTFNSYSVKAADPSQQLYGKYRLTATLVELKSGLTDAQRFSYNEGVERVLGSVQVNFEIIDASQDTLTYSIDFPETMPAYGEALQDVGKLPSTYDVTYMWFNGKVLKSYNPVEFGRLQDTSSNRHVIHDRNGDGIKSSVELNANREFSKYAEVRAQTADGSDFKLDEYKFDMVRNIYTSNDKVLAFVKEDTGAKGFRGYSMEPGKVTIYMDIKAIDGTIKTLKKDVEVVETQLYIDKVAKFTEDRTLKLSTFYAGKDADGTLTNWTLDNRWIFDKNFLSEDIEIRDQNNMAIDQWIAGYDDIYAINFLVDNVKHKKGATSLNTIRIEKNTAPTSFYTKAENNFNYSVVLERDGSGKVTKIRHYSGTINLARNTYNLKIQTFLNNVRVTDADTDFDKGNIPLTDAAYNEIITGVVNNKWYKFESGNYVEYDSQINNTGDVLKEIGYEGSAGPESRFAENYRIRVLKANGTPVTSPNDLTIEQFSIYITYPGGVKEQRITLVNDIK